MPNSSAMTGPGSTPARDDVAVLAVVGKHIVIRRQRRHQADDRRLFAQVEVAVAADLGFGVHLAGALFEDAQQQHLMVVVLELIRILAGQVVPPIFGGARLLRFGAFGHCSLLLDF